MSDATVAVGADEAGKGPVLGPMVAAAVRAEPSALPPVADSKRLSASRRETLATKLRERVAWAVACVPTAVIDDPATDMNGVTVAAQAAAVRALARDGDRLQLDAGDTDEARFGRRVRRAVCGETSVDGRIRVECGPKAGEPSDGGAENPATPAETRDWTTEIRDTPDAVSVTAEHGADDTYPLVAAASVLAKVVRDDRVETVNDRYDRAVGSGYPSDGTTRTFLREYVREHGELPDCARESWRTAQDVLGAAEQSDLDSF